MEQPLPVPVLVDGETATYRGLIDGAPVGEGTVAVAVDADRIVQTIDAEAYDRVALETTTSFRTARGQLVAETVRTVMRDRDRTVVEEDVALRAGEVVQIGGGTAPYPRAVLPVHGAWVGMRALELVEGARVELPVWLASVAHWPVAVEVLAPESVEVPAGEVEAWKLLLRPALGSIAGPLEDLVRSLVPPVVAHLETAPTQRLVRLAFPTGPGRSAPTGLLEAVALDDGA